MVLVQELQFIQLFCLGNIGKRNVFYDILEGKNAFQAIKPRSSKSRKIDIFQKRLTNGFCPIMAIFPTVFFQAIQARKMSFTIFQNDKTPFQAIKTRTPNSRKIDIFPKGLTHCFGTKITIFPTSFFLGNISQGNIFTIIQNEKTPF